MSNELIFTLACAFVALGYGVVSVRWILAKPAGTPRMQEIANAIQEGAKAYLNRQYTTIAIAGIVLLVIIGIFIGWITAIGFAIGTVQAACGIRSLSHSHTAVAGVHHWVRQHMPCGLFTIWRCASIT